METDLGVLIGGKISCEGRQIRPNEGELGAKGKKAEVETLVERDDGMDEVKLSVSHLDLTANLKPFGGTRLEITSQATNQLAGPRKSKDKALKEITNKLDVRPIKLKSSRAGSRMASGQQNKESKSLKRVGKAWMRKYFNGPINIHSLEPIKPNTKLLLVGSSNSRPPDPFTENIVED